MSTTFRASRPSLRPHSLVALLALILMVVVHPVLAQPSKIDPALRTLCRSVPTASKTGYLPQVVVLVKVTDGGRQASDYVRARGGLVSSVHGDIAVAHLPASALSGLAALDSVSYVEASQNLSATMDVARNAAVGANAAVFDSLSQERRPTGRGVLVGMIDTGADTASGFFLDESGKSRVLRYWQQGIDNSQRYPTVSMPDGTSRTFSLGREYTNLEFDEGVQRYGDPGYHGSHVLGIAAGRHATYSGMAPEAGCLVVTNRTNLDFWRGASTGSTLDAYAYLIGRASEMKLPLVVNQSQGSNLGPHDGSSLFEQAIQDDITRYNLILCVSAGNNGTRNKRAQVSIPASGSGKAALWFDQRDDPSTQLYNSVDIWLRKGDATGAAPTLRIAQYDSSENYQGQSAIIPWQTASGSYDIVDPSTNVLSTVAVAGEYPSPLNQDNHLLLTFTGSTVGARPVYLITFTNANGSTSTADLYVQRNSKSAFYDSSYLGASSLTTAGTLGTPGTTPGAITVGNYVTRPTYTDRSGTVQGPNGRVLGDLAASSSVGPPRQSARYTGNNQRKPDLSAPGSMIVSALARGYKDNASDSEVVTTDGTDYLCISGTSMSTPVVCGAVALMLQDAPNATPGQIKGWLIGSVKRDAITGASPNDRWGAGKLDAQAAFDKVVSPQPSIASAVLSATTVKIPNIGTSRAITISGTNMAFTSQVKVDGEVYDARRVYWASHRQIVVAVGRSASPRTVQVINTKAAAGQQESNIQAVDTLAKASPLPLLPGSLPPWLALAAAMAVVACLPRVRHRRGAVAVLLLSSIAVTLFGCSGGSGTSATPQVSGQTTLTISPQTPSVAAGQQVQLTAALRLPDGTLQDVTELVDWASTNAHVAEVSVLGEGDTYKAGQSVISAALSGQTASTTLTVNAPALEGIKVTPSVQSLPGGFTVALTALGEMSDGSEVDVTSRATWASSSSAVTVDGSGNASAQAAGTATVTASYGGFSGTAALTVDSATLTSVQLESPDEGDEMVPGDRRSLQAIATFSDGSTLDVSSQVLWASSVPGVATINAKGVATATGAGETAVTATLGAVSSAPVSLVVGAAYETVQFVSATASLTVGQSRQMQVTAVAAHDDGQVDVTAQTTGWTSSNTAVATVNAQGLVQAVGAGTARITATVGGQPVFPPATITVTP